MWNELNTFAAGALAGIVFLAIGCLFLGIKFGGEVGIAVFFLMVARALL